MSRSPVKASTPPNIPASFEAPAWCAQFIGIPYARLNCWGLVAHVLRQHFGLPVPLYRGQMFGNTRSENRTLATFIKAEADGPRWVERWAKPADNDYLPAGLTLDPGDVLLLRMDGLPVHVGVIAAEPWFLHTEEAMDSALAETTSPRWVRRIEGVYRFGGPRDDPSTPGDQTA